MATKPTRPTPSSRRVKLAAELRLEGLCRFHFSLLRPTLRRLSVFLIRVNVDLKAQCDVVCDVKHEFQDVAELVDEARGWRLA